MRDSSTFAAILASYMPAPKTTLKLPTADDLLAVKPTNFKQQQNAKVKTAMNATKQRAGALAGSARAIDIRGDVRLAVKNWTDQGQRLTKAFGTVWRYDKDGGDFKIAELDPAFLAVVMCNALFGGPKQLRTVGGSRLPAPIGTLWVAGAHGRTREDVLQFIGVPVEELPRYKKVRIHHLDWGNYERRVELVAQGNTYQFANHDGSVRAVYTSFVETARASNSRIQTGGVAYRSDDEFLNIAPDSVAGQKIAGASGGLGPATAGSGWILGTSIFTASRGKGQTSAMNGWNALGAAAYGNTFLAKQYDLAQNWLWLHIRGAQLGGATTGANLVAGWYTTNSAMIPFEAMIERWAKAGPQAFEARFLAHGAVSAFCNRIELQIRTTNQPTLGTLPAQSLATFDPLTGKLVDKMAGEFIKRPIDANVHA